MSFTDTLLHRSPHEKVGLLNQDASLAGDKANSSMRNSPDVEFCGYSAPHPSEYKIHLRVQMFDHKSALDALLKGLCDLEDLFTVLQEKYAEDFNKGQYETITPEEINWDEVKAKAQAVSVSFCCLFGGLMAYQCSSAP